MPGVCCRRSRSAWAGSSGCLAGWCLCLRRPPRRPVASATDLGDGGRPAPAIAVGVGCGGAAAVVGGQRWCPVKKSFLDELEAKGWVQQPNGEWSKPRPGGAVGGLGTGVGVEPARPLVGEASPVGVGVRRARRGNGPRRGAGWPGSGPGPVVRVIIIAARPKLIDDDNLAGGCKSLRDAIARKLGVDDGDPRVSWEYRQLVGPPFGCLVLIS